jgi:hypothetical protein
MRRRTPVDFVVASEMASRSRSDTRVNAEDSASRPGGQPDARRDRRQAGDIESHAGKATLRAAHVVLHVDDHKGAVARRHLVF